MIRAATIDSIFFILRVHHTEVTKVGQRQQEQP